MPQRLKVAIKKVTSKPQINGDNEDRHHMISTAAYFRAEQHGFDGVYELQDWLEAEAEIDTKFYR
ncbi:MAG: DUF2934 domain-containing protein [Gallionella sp.]